VLLEVKIVEVNASNDLKLGVDYINWKNGPGRNLFEFVYQGVDAQSRNRMLTSAFDPFRVAGDAAGATSKKKLLDNYNQTYRAANYLLTSNFVDFMQAKGQAQVLTRQSLMVQSANTVSISTEDTVVALVSSPADVDTVGPDTAQGIAANISTPRNTKTPVEVVPGELRDSDRRLNNPPAGVTGLFVSLTPFVGLESMELVISITNSDLNGVAPNGQPIINRRTLSSTVRLFDGEPYVISGLKRKHNVRETAKAPGLGNLPVLGYLFGGETNR
jgi:type II secretory pathway component GspD/PulD (secretin)